MGIKGLEPPASYLTYGSGEDALYGARRDRHARPANPERNGDASILIERVRRDADDADARSVSAEEVSVARHRQ